MSTGMRKENNGSGGRHAKKRLEEQGSGRVAFLFTSFVKGKGVPLAVMIIRERYSLSVSLIFCNQKPPLGKGCVFLRFEITDR
ncbi:hypothetical protein HMPREF3224_02190 [Anaerococcus hydrogenalis]|nr:hypothetical protein HMPREF3224_02190 [Anaerococcus hydrogenalis]